ncbi:hypothetical protein TTHERM_01075810, partial (macronuclear) [Tetrahymena thermophila SB210]
HFQKNCDYLFCLKASKQINNQNSFSHQIKSCQSKYSNNIKKIQQMNMQSTQQKTRPNKVMTSLHPAQNILSTQNPIYLPENKIEFKSRYSLPHLHHHNINQRNQLNQNFHSLEVTANERPFSFYNYLNTPDGLPTTQNYYLHVNCNEKDPQFQYINNVLQINNDQSSSIIIADKQHYQLINPSQLFPNQHMIHINPLQKSLYPNYSHMVQPQQSTYYQGFPGQVPINTYEYCYSNSISQNNSQQPDQIIPKKQVHNIALDEEPSNLVINNQIQETKDNQKVSFYNSKRKTLEVYKNKQNDCQDSSSSKDTLGQQNGVRQENSLQKQNDKNENNNWVHILNTIIKNEYDSEKKAKKININYEQNQKNEELKVHTQLKQQQIQLFNQLDNQCQQNDNSNNQQSEQKVLKQQQQNSNNPTIQEDQGEFKNQSKLYSLQYFKKQTCGFRKKSKNDTEIEVESTINQFIQFKDNYLKIENNFQKDHDCDEQKMQSSQQTLQNQTLFKLDKGLLKKRKLYQKSDEDLINKLSYTVKVESNHESLLSQNSNLKKKHTIKIQQELKQNLNSPKTSVIKQQQKLQENVQVDCNQDNQNESITNEHSQIASTFSDEFLIDLKKQQLLNFRSQKASLKNKKGEKSDQKQKNRCDILKQIENEDKFFDEYENQEEWEDSFFHQMKQNSRSGGKSFFLVSNYKKRLFKQLEENDQSVILSMKKSKKFNFSKNVIKQFLKVMNSQINYIYILDENSNNKSDQQTQIAHNEKFCHKIQYNAENVQKLTQENESHNFDQEIQFKQSNLNNNKKQKNNQFDQQSAKKEDNFDRSKYIQIQNPSQSLLNELRQKLKKFLISTSYTHFSLKKIISHKYYSLYFQDFLQNYSDEWIQSGKTKYKNEQKIMIHFLKLCFCNRKLLIFLSQHDPLKNKDSNENEE